MCFRNTDGCHQHGHLVQILKGQLHRQFVQKIGWWADIWECIRQIDMCRSFYMENWYVYGKLTCVLRISQMYTANWHGSHMYTANWHVYGKLNVCRSFLKCKRQICHVSHIVYGKLKCIRQIDMCVAHFSNVHHKLTCVAHCIRQIDVYTANWYVQLISEMYTANWHVSRIVYGKLKYIRQILCVSLISQL